MRVRRPRAGRAGRRVAARRTPPFQSTSSAAPRFPAHDCRWPDESLSILFWGRPMMNLQTLVLNADYRPLSYHPLSLWSWRDALTALMLDRVALVANYDVLARSPSVSFPVPSVVALKRYNKLGGFPAFTRYNIY